MYIFFYNLSEQHFNVYPQQLILNKMIKFKITTLKYLHDIVMF